MLPKKNRTDRKTVEKVFKEGRFVNSANLSFKYMHPTPALPLANGRENSIRISFTAPKTACKRAVGRNLLRRRGYAVLRKLLKNEPHQEPHPTLSWKGEGLIGVFVFGKKSMEFFGKKKNKLYNPILNLENEIKNILNKIN
ncbi:MAG: ribonuclease P protein component [Candidatus Nomurabacteria bacterium]|nr:ribonuclease P protein component [Candidatus Nomurabacteria bacterium]